MRTREVLGELDEQDRRAESRSALKDDTYNMFSNRFKFESPDSQL